MPVPQKTATDRGCAITLLCEIFSSGAFGLSPEEPFLRDPAGQRGGNLSDVILPTGMRKHPSQYVFRNTYAVLETGLEKHSLSPFTASQREGGYR